jgi:transcriptional regulator with XRE-family HTH domain
MTLRVDRTEFQTQFGDRLSSLRRAKSLSQFDLAEKAGYTSRTICNLEGGFVWPALMTVFVLAEVLDVHPKTLLFGEGPPNA